jgi:hypothetical protein
MTVTPLRYHVMLAEDHASLSNARQDYGTFQLCHSLALDQRQIYRVCSGLLVVTALKLLWDGVSGCLL